ncbi:carcinine hydrolase/isopenicillin-N N-acyltransferase family protein [Flexithrix dorotheae]|uniref:carcinine hydrolase/isopenicillin-N N-acyltransferase family protein n=1 Tax=Flexithrix dorotheae TaxID=70993 RepID=UPI00036C38E5|nr:carcinine hydrolase/isopenicillin-N N-acyltransferase family protein [Flexithrix dorotheae]
MKTLLAISLFFLLLGNLKTSACSVVYYIDPQTGNIYIANNEDFWYDTKAYIQLMPKTNHEHARLWYGWDNFAQGGINEHGLFFDGAVTPEQEIPEGYHSPKGNLGDRILASCSTVEEALIFLEKGKIALKNAHVMFGDAQGNAVVVEWVDKERKLVWINENHLVMTNFLLSDTTRGNYPCYRYAAIEKQVDALKSNETPPSFLKVSNVLGPAAQIPKPEENGKIGGTLYSSFIDVTNMEFILAYKLDNSRVTKIDMRKAFGKGKKRKIKLE